MALYFCYGTTNIHIQIYLGIYTPHMYVSYKNNVFHNVRSQSHWKCTYKIIFSLYISRYTMIKPTESTLKKLAFSPVEHLHCLLSEANVFISTQTDERPHQKRRLRIEACFKSLLKYGTTVKGMYGSRAN